MSIKRILVVDNDNAISNFLFGFLSAEGFEVITAANGNEGYAKFKKYQPHLVILDIVMPELDGYSTCLKIREESNIPIIFLSARNQTKDRVMGLACGGDDFITKPFDSAELLLRIQAVLRRTMRTDNLAGQGVISVQELTVNRGTRIVQKNEQIIQLTTKEFELLWLLISHPEQVFTRDQLIYQIWNSEYSDDSAVVTMLIKRLREKIEDDPAHPRYIKTIRGVGYKFESENC